MSELVYKRHSGERMLAMLEDITNLYVDIRSENPDEQYDIYSRSSFVERTTNQARKPGFELVAATLNGFLVGFSFGYPLPPEAWWGDCTPAPQDVLGSSKFAVIELDVHKSYRRQGIAKKLLDMLLGDRTEKFATLAVIPGSIADDMYKRWGWYKIGEFTDSMEALVIPIVQEDRGLGPLRPFPV